MSGYSTDWKVAADPQKSAWVSANAGAGKTHTLANRVARLLLADAVPAKILCLTYTKAAAAEMQGRLFEQLGRWSMLDDAALTEAIEEIGGARPDKKGLREARRLFARALETPGGLKIQTIHAFCERLLSRFPLEAGVPPSFRVLDDQTARELLAEARARILEHAGSGDKILAAAIGHLVTQTSETRLNQILDSVTGSDRRKLEFFLDGLGGDDDALRRAAERAHGAGENETHDSVAGDFCRALEKEEADIRELIAWLSSGGVRDREKAAVLQEYLEASGAAVVRFEILRDGLLTDGELYKKYAVNALADARPDLLQRLIHLATDIHAAAERCKAARAAQLAHAAFVVVRAMRRIYADEKRLRGMLDYDDLIAKTLELLNTRPDAAWVLYKLDGGLDHILIDEAQDTSPEQWKIVQALTEEMFAGEGREREHVRTIFAVGDEKQSIFSFQGAEPEEFERNRQHFQSRSENFADVRLETSRRSVPEVLGFVDQVFAEDAAREGLSQTAIAHRAHRAKAKGRVELWPTLKPAKGPDLDLWRLKPVDVESKTSPVAVLADRVAAQIAEWIARRRRLPGRDKPIRAGDIMILMPRREPFASEIIRRLKEKNIPVAGADRMKLTGQIAVMDMIALGRFAVLPEDDLNLAALLRSPLIDIGEDELRELAYGREGKRLWSMLTTRRAEAPYAAAHEFLSEMLARADFSPPYEFYAHALVEKQARLKLLTRLGPEAADALDEFASLALTYEQNNTPSLEGFLHWLERSEAEIKRDMDRGRDEVRVMTVHGSKGLEADIVILPDTTTLAQGAGRHGEFLFTKSGDVVFPMRKEDSPRAVLAAKAEADEATRRERRRLLYVALTRAKDRLIVCGFENTKGIEDGSWYDLTRRAAEKMGQPVLHGDEQGFVIGDADTEAFGGAEDKPAETIELKGWMRKPAPVEIVKPRLVRASDAAGLEEPATLSPLGEKGAKRFQRGNLIHGLLARLPGIDIASRRDAALRYLRANKVANDEAEKLADETLAVIADPQFAAAFAPGSRAEVALVADLPDIGGGARLNGRIDRLAITADEVLVVDFKTNRPPPAKADNVATVYKAQMALYKAALSKVFPGKRITCALVWTDGPSLMPLPDALLEAEIGAIRARLDSPPSAPKY
ncbi:MAG: double-strand break repair helicase AddA [Proteobacteria bacterium]|nr:double-strand break repair helicase AddA [Pseudomonadota bacterium]